MPSLIEAVKIRADRRPQERRSPSAARRSARITTRAATAPGRRPPSPGTQARSDGAAVRGDLRPDQGSRLVAGAVVGQRQRLAAAAVADGQALSLDRHVRRLRRRLGLRRRRSAGRSPTATRAGSRSRSSPTAIMMYVPGALWTAARHKIPMLAVMHNNRGYHQEVMHVQRLSNFRNRVANTRQRSGPDRHQHHESRHRVSQARGIDGLVGQGSDQGSGRSRARRSRKRSPS